MTVSNFSGTDTGTFFWDENFLVPVLFLGPNFSGTGTSTIQKEAKFLGPGCHTLALVHFKKKIFGIYRILRIDTIALVSKFEYKLQHALLSSWSIIITSSLQLTLIVILGHNGSND